MAKKSKIVREFHLQKKVQKHFELRKDWERLLKIQMFQMKRNKKRLLKLQKVA